MEWLDYSKESIEKHDQIHFGYNYDIKLNNIGVKSNRFDRSSVYVSKPFIINKPISNIVLNAEEELIDGTDIEYYISFKEIPTVDDWIPIIPINRSEKTHLGSLNVQHELLFFNEYNEAKLRFADADDIEVFQSGEAINFTEYLDSSNQVVIQISNYNPRYIYTASYTSKQDYLTVNESDFLTKTAVDIFDGTDDDNKVTLTKLFSKNLDIKLVSQNGLVGPRYVERESSFRNMRSVIEVDKNGAKQRNAVGEIFETQFPKLQDMSSKFERGFSFTLYNPNIKNGDTAGESTRPRQDEIFVGSSEPADPNVKVWVDLDEGDSSTIDTPNTDAGDTNTILSGEYQMMYPYFDYYFKDNNVYFAQRFDEYDEMGSAEIQVSYQYVEMPLRVKIILRNNSTTPSLTPIVKRYQLNLY